MQHFIGNKYRIIPMVFVMGMIFFFSHQSGDNLELPTIPFVDKAAHLIVYALLGGATLFSFSPQILLKQGRKCIIISVIFCCLYGISDELHQSLIPGRFVSGFDLLADVIGGFFGCLVYVKIQEIVSSASFRQEKVE